MNIVIDKDLCVNCGACVGECMTTMIREVDGEVTVVDNCHHLCSHCVSVCPQGAISITDYDMSEVLPITPGKPQVNGDDLLLAMKSRRSVRYYKDKKVEPEVINKLIEAVRYCPTGGNKQANKVIVVQDKLPEFIECASKVLDNLVDNAPEGVDIPLYQAYQDVWHVLKPLWASRGTNALFFTSNAVLIFVGQDQVDACLAASYAEIEAYALGLGTCYIAFMEKAGTCKDVREFLGLADDEKVLCALTIGYPAAEFYQTAPRKKANVKYM